MQHFRADPWVVVWSAFEDDIPRVPGAIAPEGLTLRCPFIYELPVDCSRAGRPACLFAATMVLIHRLVPISADNPGDAASPGREHILAILPYPEDKKVVAALEEKHNCTVDWRDITFPESSFATGIDKPESYIPDGIYA